MRQEFDRILLERAREVGVSIQKRATLLDASLLRMQQSSMSRPESMV